MLTRLAFPASAIIIVLLLSHCNLWERRVKMIQRQSHLHYDRAELIPQDFGEPFAKIVFLLFFGGVAQHTKWAQLALTKYLFPCNTWGIWGDG